VVSLFMLAIPISSIIGSPISGLLLGVTGLGLDGWQWLFILEAVPSVLVGICVLFYLTDFPRQARWLQPDEIAWLESVQATEKQNKEKVERLSLWQALTDPRILLCALVYFCLNAASYGVAFFLPTIIKGFGVSDTQTGFLAALPFVFGAIGMVLLGRHSDRTMERKGHVAVALLMAAVGVGLAGFIANPVIVMALLCFAQIGISAVPPMFWPLPASFLTGASAAAGIAAINSLGNLSGFAGPYAMGYLKDLTGNFTAGLLLLAGCALLGAIVVLMLRIDVRREQVSGEISMAH
jgi:ACS family tartrate transporter-like MFS transporter